MKQVQRKSKLSRMFGNWRKKLHKLGQFSPWFSRKNWFVWEASSNTLKEDSFYLQNLKFLKNTWLRFVFSTPLGVWCPLLMFELLHTICHTQDTISYYNIVCPTISYHTIPYIIHYTIAYIILYLQVLPYPCYTIYSMLYQLLIPVTKHSNR